MAAPQISITIYGDCQQTWFVSAKPISIDYGVGFPAIVTSLDLTTSKALEKDYPPYCGQMIFTLTKQTPV